MAKTTTMKLRCLGDFAMSLVGSGVVILEGCMVMGVELSTSVKKAWVALPWTWAIRSPYQDQGRHRRQSHSRRKGRHGGSRQEAWTEPELLV